MGKKSLQIQWPRMSPLSLPLGGGTGDSGKTHLRWKFMSYFYYCQQDLQGSETEAAAEAADRVCRLQTTAPFRNKERHLIEQEKSIKHEKRH